MCRLTLDQQNPYIRIYPSDCAERVKHARNVLRHTLGSGDQHVNSSNSTTVQWSVIYDTFDSDTFQIMQRWNPDNPTSYSPSARTPTPLRRSGASQFTSSVFAAPPPPRVIAGGASIPRCVEGACETKQTSFEWPVRGVRELKSQLALDDDNVDDETRHEVLSGEGAYFDDLAYKLHLGG